VGVIGWHVAFDVASGDVKIPDIAVTNDNSSETIVADVGVADVDLVEVYVVEVEPNARITAAKPTMPSLRAEPTFAFSEKKSGRSIP
jgi:hypothetical protein